MAELTEGNTEFRNLIPENEQLKKLFGVCAKINVWHKNITENQHPLASSRQATRLIKDNSKLIEELQNAPKLLSDEKSNYFKKRGKSIQRRYQNLQYLANDEKKYKTSSKIDIKDFSDPKQILEEMISFVKEPGWREIRFNKVWRTHLESPAYGDNVSLKIERNVEGKFRIFFDEMLDYNHFKSPHTKGFHILDLARIINPNLTGKNVRQVIPGAKEWYPMPKIIAGPVSFTTRGHDYGGTQSFIDVHCDKLDQVEKVTEFLLKMIKTHPRIEKNQKKTS